MKPSGTQGTFWVYLIGALFTQPVASGNVNIARPYRYCEIDAVLPLNLVRNH